MIKSKNISLNTNISKSEGNIVSDMNGEKVMLSVTNGKYYNLGEIGGDIWDFININTTVVEIINHLLSSYDIEQCQCEEQVLYFLEHLFQEKLIQIK